MHFLARILHGGSAVSDELSRDENRFQDDMRRFLASFAMKQDVLRALLAGEPISMHLYKLQEALREEAASIEEGERAEKEILQDLKYLSREHYIRELDDLCAQLAGARTRDAYLRTILSELHDTLLSEARKVRRLLAGETDIAIGQAVLDLLMIERHLVEKLSAAEDFRRLFADLRLGTWRRGQVEMVHQRLREQLEGIMRNVEPGPDGTLRSTDGHYISALTARIFNLLEQAIMRAVSDGSIGDHPAVDAEYVQSDLFDRLVRDEIRVDKAAGKYVPSERTISGFVAIFREIYAGAQAGGASGDGGAQGMRAQAGA